jgi:hypothetical protein
MELLNIINVIKSGRMRLAHMVEFRNVCKILVRKPGSKRCPGRCSWQCNIKMSFS